jgi:hypothetical protein
MRAFFLVVLVVGSFVYTQLVYGQSQARNSEAESVVLRAKVLSVREEALPRASVVAVTVTLKLEFVNTGEKPVILLINRSPLCVGTTLTRSAAPALGDNILFDEYRGPSVSTTPDWKAFRTTLDQPKPPVGLFHVIKPGESWATDSFVVLRPPSKLERYRVDRSPVSRQILKESSPVWLRLKCDVWPFNVEHQPTSGKMRFGRELHKRWQDVGELQLNSLESEPMEVDLRQRGQADSPKP